MNDLSALDDSIPLTLAQAVGKDGNAVLILLFVILPVGLTVFCAILEMLMAFVMIRAPKLRLMKAAIVSNIAGVVLLFVGCVGVLALLTYLNSQSRLPLWVVGGYAVPVALAIWVKVHTFRSYISRQRKGCLPTLFVLSHLLAAAALYYTHQYYVAGG